MRRDRSTELDGAADGAQPVVRPLHGLGQHLAGGVAVCAGGNVTRNVTVMSVSRLPSSSRTFVGADVDVERLRLGSTRREDVDVDRRAPADRRQQQLGRREVAVRAGAERHLAAALVDGGEASRSRCARR